VHLVPQTSIEHGAFPEARFLVRRESILFPQASRWIVLMLVVPVMRHLLIVFVESWAILAVLAISLTILSDEKTSARTNHKRGKYNLAV
jgi:hypothetical protein